MKRRSIARRLISSVLLVELAFAVGIIALAAAYERHTRFHAFEFMLQGRTDSLIGAVQDAEDAGDHLMFDRTGLTLPPEDVYEIRDSTGALVARSPNWTGADAEHLRHPAGRAYRTRIQGRPYRVLVRQGMRVVDPGDQQGGTARRFVVAYGAPIAPVWHEVDEAIAFYAFTSLALLVITGMLMGFVLHRGLAPLRQLAAEAEGLSVQRWSFTPPRSAAETRELAPLASALAAAIGRLQQSFAQQRRFVGDAAHELKTAVAVVKSSLQLLNLRPRTAAEYEQGVDLTLKDCQRMEEIVARMLVLGRVEDDAAHGDAPAVADLAACLADTVQQLQSVAELRQVSVATVPLPPTYVAVLVEECMLLCSNLLLNALQHSQPNTQVELTVTDAAGWAELRVQDEGDGIAPALLPQVFERFSRSDPSRSRNTGGTGLGLAICKAIVDKRGGFIELQSELGRGTLALVRLPRAAAPDASTALSTTPSGRVNAGVTD